MNAACWWLAVLFGILFIFTGGGGFLLLFFLACAAGILTREG